MKKIITISILALTLSNPILASVEPRGYIAGAGKIAIATCHGLAKAGICAKNVFVAAATSRPVKYTMRKACKMRYKTQRYILDSRPIVAAKPYIYDSVDTVCKFGRMVGYACTSVLNLFKRDEF